MDTRKEQGQDLAQGAMLGRVPDPAMISMDEVSGMAEPELERSKRPATPLQDSLRRLRRDKRAMVSLGILVFMVLIALIGPPIYQHIGGPYVNQITGQTVGPQSYHNYYYENLADQDQGPSAQYWLGTDQLGRDILARLMQGILVSIFVALFVEVFDVVLGISIGVLAGYYGGLIDQFLARFTDIMLAFPGLLFIIMVAGIFGSSADSFFSHVPVIGPNGNARLLLVGIVLGIVIWPFTARLVRGQTLQLKEQQFVEAARTSGTTNTRIILRHIVPNLLSIVVVTATLNLSNTIVGEAGISLLGLGVQPPGSSLGKMIADGAQNITSYPREVIIPCIVLTLIVLCFCFLGDGMRDAFDPRSKD
ncbi:MAG TPA: ABC transporter permease [Ktedonobacteraceae bacterium]|jgi:oligopeptide transport system permease protein|nr:ABC transporter permease [Ktedonobacteraceae bacterium]